MPLGWNLFNYGFYNKLYTDNDVYESLNEQDVMEMTYKVFDFFKYRGNLNGQVRYADPARSSVAFFTDNEISHMEDVRKLLRNIFLFFSASLIMFLILFFITLFLHRGNTFKKMGFICLWASLSVLFIFLLLFILSTNFSSLFDRFHVIFFPQGNYIFPAESLLLKMFPFGFFYDFFIRLIISSGALAAAILLIGVILTLIGTREPVQKLGPESAD